MAKSTINFEGASFKLTGSSATVRPDGYRYNEVQHKRIILSDGTQFDFDRYGWSRWIENKHYRRFPDSRGHHRKCNERYCNLLNKAWHNFTRENRGANDN